MSYLTTPYQLQILTSNISTQQLSMFQRNSISKLQFYKYHNHNFIKSTQDQYKHSRIIILSLLIKIFEECSQLNQDRLNKFKGIVYSAFLEKITKPMELQRKQLHKIVAQQLARLNEFYDTENRLLNMFNCVSFFDQILLRAFQEKMITQNNQLPEIQYFENLLKREFSLSIVRNPEDLQNYKQKDNQLCLWQENDNLLKMSEFDVTFIDQSSEEESVKSINSGNSKRGSRPLNKNKMKKTLLQSISINSTFNPKFQVENTLRNEKELKFETQNISSFEENSFSKEKLNKQPIYSISQNQPIHKIQKPKPKQKGFWSSICCLQ